MDEPDQTFNWPDGDVILRATHGVDSRDFRVHKLLLSLASPVFKDMFQLARPTSTADTIDLTDPPWAVEVILRFIYPNFESPTIDDLTILSEVLAVAEKYDIAAARSQFRKSLAEFSKTESLRVYAIAYKLGYEDEMKIASTRTTSIYLPRIDKLPEEFKSVPATEYHRLLLLHARYRKKVEKFVKKIKYFHTKDAVSEYRPINYVTEEQRQPVLDSVGREGPLDYESLALAAVGSNRPEVDEYMITSLIREALEKADELSLTV